MKFRRGTSLTLLAALLGAGAVLAAPAQAAHGNVSCGQTITSDITLANDIGPCPGDGLIVTASGITVNLNGYTITGSNTTNTSSTEQVGIRLAGVSDVTVNGRGTVRNFDAGVSIEGGARNTVQEVSAVDNINHSAFTGNNNRCLYGDGILTVDSDDNLIRRNLLENNGPFDGAALVGDSDRNTVTGNHAVNNRSLNVLPDGENGPCGPFQATGEGPGRPDQNIGIRIEGPGASDNTVSENIVDNNLLNGISVNGYVSAFPPGVPFPPQAPNANNNILRNTVTRNGFNPVAADQDGIAVLRQGPFGTVVSPAQNTTIVANTSTDNARHGIFMPALTSNNTISRNLVDDNGVDGILVQGPFEVCVERDADRNCTRTEPRPGSTNNTLFANRGTGNGEHDGHDDNPNCDANRWRRNLFAEVNQPCVAGNGGTGTVPPAAAPASASASVAASEPESDGPMSGRSLAR